MNKKMMRINIILSIIVFFSIAGMLVCNIFSYKANKSNESKNDIKTSNVNLLINYYNNDIIDIKNLDYNLDYEYYFSITNNSSDIISSSNLVFEILNPIDMYIDENFNYTIELLSEEKEDETYANKSETPVPVSNKKIGSITIIPNSTQEYKLTIKLNKKNQSKNYYKNKEFKGKITLAG